MVHADSPSSRDSFVESDVTKPNPIPLVKRQIVKFWTYVKKTDSCWLWTRYRQSHGYGAMYFNSTRQLTHRISWQLANGAIPPGMNVLHRCDVGACVNPDHLFLGTQPDNVRDMIDKGRHPLFNNSGLCLKGIHKIEGSNIRLTVRGNKICRQCALDGRKRRYRLTHPQRQRTCSLVTSSRLL